MANNEYYIAKKPYTYGFTRCANGAQYQTSNKGAIMNVLSLFDGMRGTRLALDKTAIVVDNYYSSEVDKYAIQIANKNYPQDEENRLGSVIDLEGIKIPNIELLIGGSPCQNFSFGGTRKGMATECEIEITTLEEYLELKNEGFEFKGQSYLFWEYMRILKETKPKYFLLENVKMAKKWKDILTKAIGVEPIEINSDLVSGQNRSRLFWTNIPNVKAPKDKNISLPDIMDELEYIEHIEPFKECVRKNIVRDYDKIILSDKKIFVCECTSGFQDNKVGIKKSPTLRAGNSFTLGLKNGTVRRLKPIEWERLQTVPEGYTEGVSNTQRFKMLGNGFTIDVIAHILSFINDKNSFCECCGRGY